MIIIKCEKCGHNFKKEFQDEYDLCDECLDAMSFEEWNMSKKYGRSGRTQEEESEYLEKREQGYSADEAYEFIENKNAMKRTLKGIFGHNGWNL